jgi:ABC-2 type transport system ATP-binding protein
MWALVRKLRAKGVTVLLTTHYIEEAEEMADRVGVINKGKLLLVDEKAALMRKMGKRRLTLTLPQPLAAIPAALGDWPLALEAEGQQLVYTFEANADHTGISALLRRLDELHIEFKDLETERSSLEDIFINLLETA